MTTPLKVAARHHEKNLRRLYARLLVAMSMEDAKTTLGFPPSASPSPGEVARAYKQKSLEHHPDRGGDPTKMVEVNVAKEILDGKRRADPGMNTPYGGGGTSGPPVTYTPVKREEITVTFQEAKSQASIPSGVQWKFVTEPGRSGYSSDEFERTATGWVAVGETDSAWVFVAAEHYYSDAYVVGDSRPKEDIWRIHVVKLAKKGAVDARTLYGGVMKAWKGFTELKKRFNSKVIPAEGWVLNEKLPQGGSLSIKNYLLNSGLMDETQLKTPRKQTIEVHYEKSYDKKPGYYQVGRVKMDWEKLVLIINGKSYDLNEAQAQRLMKIRIGGKDFLERVFGQYYYGGETKSLSRNRAGKEIMAFMAEKLPGLPDWVKASLEAASTQQAAPKGRRR